MIVFNEKYRQLPTKASYLNKYFQEYLKICDEKVDIQSIREVCTLAKEYGLWVYDGKNKGWSSPDGFAEGVWNYKQEKKVLFEKVEFRDPLEGVIAGHQVLEVRINKLLSNIEKMDIKTILLQMDELRYYQIKLHQLTKKVIEYDRRAWK